jgi:hypothetical protein
VAGAPHHTRLAHSSPTSLRTALAGTLDLLLENSPFFLLLPVRLLLSHAIWLTIINEKEVLPRRIGRLRGYLSKSRQVADGHAAFSCRRAHMRQTTSKAIGACISRIAVSYLAELMRSAHGCPQEGLMKPYSGFMSPSRQHNYVVAENGIVLLVFPSMPCRRSRPRKEVMWSTYKSQTGMPGWVLTHQARAACCRQIKFYQSCEDHS